MTESISPGELRGLATFLCSIRDDWENYPVRAALEELQGYALDDVAEVCTKIARNRSNQYPKMLAIKGAEDIRAKHSGKHKARINRVPDQYRCDTCGKVRSACLTAAGNLNGADHEFRSAAERNDDRDEMHADGRIAQARADAISKAAGGLFALPRDVAEVHIPQDPKKESA